MRRGRPTMDGGGLAAKTDLEGGSGGSVDQAVSQM